jgi:hypothetical protein
LSLIIDINTCGIATMRINEFANAEEQLALWKLISDSVWTAVRTQAEQQARADAERVQQAKAKKPTSKRSKSVKAPYAPPPPPLPGMQQQQPNVANPTQLQQPTHKPLTPQQMRLQRRNSGLLRRNTSV